MKRIVALLALATFTVFAAGSASAQTGQVGVGVSSGSCFQVPGSITSPAQSAPAISTFQLGPMGWDVFLSDHAGRLVLAMSRWHQSPVSSMPSRVRAPMVGSRVTR